MSRTAILIVGVNGATANTFVVGTIGGCVIGSAVEGCITHRKMCQSLGLRALEHFVFGGWDPVAGTFYDQAVRHKILPDEIIEASKKTTLQMEPLPACTSGWDPPFDSGFKNCLSESQPTKVIDAIRCNIRDFRSRNGCDRAIVILLGPPLRVENAQVELLTVSQFQEAIKLDKTDLLSSATVYAYAAMLEGAAVIDFTPNITLEIPAIVELSSTLGVPLVGRDGSTGQTFLKAALAHLFWTRNLRIVGWYSTNILGNHDGFVLSLPEHRITKLHDKKEVLDAPRYGVSPENHVVDISYYPPRGDNKESWDSIDFQGWFGMGMQLKLNWQGRDSILAAPLLLDLIRLVDWELAKGSTGIQDQLGFYFKHPLGSQSWRSPYEQFDRLLAHYAIDSDTNRDLA